MLKRLLIAAAFFGGKLAGALIELCSHVGGFLGRTAEGDKNLRELGDFHGENLIRKQERRKPDYS